MRLSGQDLIDLLEFLDVDDEKEKQRIKLFLKSQKEMGAGRKKAKDPYRNATRCVARWKKKTQISAEKEGLLVAICGLDSISQIETALEQMRRDRESLTPEERAARRTERRGSLIRDASGRTYDPPGPVRAFILEHYKPGIDALPETIRIVVQPYWAKAIERTIAVDEILANIDDLLKMKFSR